MYYLLCYAWKHWEAGDTVRRNRLDRLETVQDLLAKILSQGIFQLIRTGLDRGFSEVHEDIAPFNSPRHRPDLLRRHRITRG
ncbi:MAG: hypothetical protein OXU68_10220 [Bacteroidota bacterium]|nr:hypothetical protein [Bacteroidota bacterium]